MNGLELNEYFFQTIRPELTERLPELYDRLAAGLVGNGSECFGYDDEISRDHDWGVSLQIWLSEADREAIPAVQKQLDELIKEHPEYPAAEATRYCADHHVCTVGDFYRALTGCPRGPESVYEWDRVPQENLAMAVNGKVFYDGAGEFSQIRKHIQDYYPEDYRLKKIAARCASIAQTGQYNYLRCVKRQDHVTRNLVTAKFMTECMGLVFLLNREFMPYYKWQYRRLQELSILGAEVAELISALTAATDPEKQMPVIEQICALLAGQLRQEGLSETEDDFLLAHAEQIQSKIADQELRNLPITYG